MSRSFFVIPLKPRHPIAPEPGAHRTQAIPEYPAGNKIFPIVLRLKF